MVSAKAMKAFPVGSKVRTTMGVRLEGTIVEAFYWKNSTDGTYDTPKPDYVPVEWTDGTKGYSWMYHIERTDK